MKKQENEAETPPENPKIASKDASRWEVYLLVNGNIKEKERKQSFEFSDCPSPEDLELAVYNSDFHPPAKYKAELRRSNGTIKETFCFTKPEPSFFQPTAKAQLHDAETDFAEEADFEEADFEEESNPNAEFNIQDLIEARAKEIALERENEELRRRLEEKEETPSNSNSQNETLAIVREMQKHGEKSFQQGLELALRLIPKNQNQQDPTELMLKMLNGTLEVQRGVRQLSEEIAPQETGESESFLGSAARFVDSIGRHAPTFLPILGGLAGMRSNPLINNQPRPQTQQQATPATNNTNGNEQSLAAMFERTTQEKKANE